MVANHLPSVNRSALRAAPAAAHARDELLVVHVDVDHGRERGLQLRRKPVQLGRLGAIARKNPDMRRNMAARPPGKAP